MTLKKLILSLTALCVMMSSCSFAEGEDFTDSIPGYGIVQDAPDIVADALYYQGGVVSRGFAKGDDSTTDSLLNLSYVLSNAPYIKLNTPSRWDVVISGGTAPYTCEAIAAYQSDLSLDEFSSPWDTYAWIELDSLSFDYTFTDAGRYFWEFHVSDASGQTLVFQTRTFETYTASDETDATTVAGKINSIIAASITDDMSDYTRALVLHDWLISNADYDQTYTNYDASGVLLEGSGVCDSYARAYQMLLAAAGIESMIVTGVAGSDENGYENHGWNLVNLDGSWYHIDCTWDDPVGGPENHAYFCLTDEEIGLDHFWNTPDNIIDGGMLVPEADGGQYSDMSEESADVDFIFDSVTDYAVKLDAFIAAKNYTPIVARYTGENISDIYNSLWTVIEPRVQKLMSQSLLLSGACSIETSGNLVILTLDWTLPSEYIRIDESACFVSIGVETIITPASFGPSNSSFTWTSSDPSIATVSGKTESTGTLYALVEGVSAGTCTITVAGKNGGSDAFNVTVLPAYQPEFNLSLKKEGDTILLSWDPVPGVTSYEIHRTVNGSDIIIASTSDTYAEIAASTLPGNVHQMIHVLGTRTIDGRNVLCYQSNAVSYGSQSIVISYDAVLPADLVTIADEAFAGCHLSAIYISDGTQTIGSRAFASCTGLQYVRIPASVQVIAEDAFSGCTLTAVAVEEGSIADDFFLQYYPNIPRIY